MFDISSILIFLVKRMAHVRRTHAAVVVSIEDLRGERIALFRSFLLRNVPVHPEPLIFQHSDVNLLKADPVGLQKSHNGLLVFLHLRKHSEVLRSICGGS